MSSLPKRMKDLGANGDRECALSAVTRLHQPTDEPLSVSDQERAAIRAELDKIRLMLEPLFPGVYGCAPVALRVQRQAADLVDRNLEEIAKQWANAVEQINRVECNEVSVAELDDLEVSLRNALCRLVSHLRDPQDIETYVYLRKHCRREFCRARALRASTRFISRSSGFCLTTFMRARPLACSASWSTRWWERSTSGA